MEKRYNVCSGPESWTLWPLRNGPWREASPGKSEPGSGTGSYLRTWIFIFSSGLYCSVFQLNWLEQSLRLLDHNCQSQSHVACRSQAFGLPGPPECAQHHPTQVRLPRTWGGISPLPQARGDQVSYDDSLQLFIGLLGTVCGVILFL